MARDVIRCVVVLFVVHSCGFSSTTPQPQTNDKLIEDFISSDWGRVSSAKAMLESRQAEAMPLLLQILDRDQKVELQNTFDLIYPGAKRFYGHGRILDYDVDWLSVRAGWALEELTFQNFGFREGAIREADLMKAVLTKQSDVRLSDPSKTPEIKTRLRAEAIARVKVWWRNAHDSWNRFDAILEALRSDDPIRQVWTLSWIRFGKTQCDRLTVENFTKYIVPEAKRLLKSKDEGVRDQAKYLLEDKEGWWLKYKTQPTNAAVLDRQSLQRELFARVMTRTCYETNDIQPQHRIHCLLYRRRCGTRVSEISRGSLSIHL